MEVQGKIKLIKETETFNDFRKRVLVLTTDEQYPQTLAIEFVQDKTDVLNNFKSGQGVKIGINLRGREWTNKEGKTIYFNTIQGWRIDAVSDVVNDAVSEVANALDAEVVEDDLPF